jgi:uncharacterized protein (TIGR02246 family)
MKERPTTLPLNEIEKIAKKNFSRWQEALATGNPEAVANLYAPEATFLPTLSAEFKREPSGVQDYFKHFLKKTPSCKIVEEAVQKLGPACYLHSGLYNFEVGPVDCRQTVEARFSFVWRKNPQEEKWQIVHHHSSLSPQE